MVQDVHRVKEEERKQERERELAPPPLTLAKEKERVCSVCMSMFCASFSLLVNAGQGCGGSALPQTETLSGLLAVCLATHILAWCC